MPARGRSGGKRCCACTCVLVGDQCPSVDQSRFRRLRKPTHVLFWTVWLVGDRLEVERVARTLCAAYRRHVRVSAAQGAGRGVRESRACWCVQSRGCRALRDGVARPESRILLGRERRRHGRESIRVEPQPSSGQLAFKSKSDGRPGHVVVRRRRWRPRRERDAVGSHGSCSRCDGWEGGGFSDDSCIYVQIRAR